MRSLALAIQWQHSADELWSAYKASHDAVERRRVQVLALLRQGKAKAQVQAITRYSDPAYAKVLHRDQEHGLDGLKDGRHQNPGARPLLSDQEVLMLAQTLHAAYTQGEVWKGEVWNGARVQAWVKDERRSGQRGLPVAGLRVSGRHRFQPANPASPARPSEPRRARGV